MGGRSLGGRSGALEEAGGRNGGMGVCRDASLARKRVHCFARRANFPITGGTVSRRRCARSSLWTERWRVQRRRGRLGRSDRECGGVWAVPGELWPGSRTGGAGQWAAGRAAGQSSLRRNWRIFGELADSHRPFPLSTPATSGHLPRPSPVPPFRPIKPPRSLPFRQLLPARPSLPSRPSRPLHHGRRSRRNRCLIGGLQAPH